MAFWRLYYHLIWATKNREDFLESKVEANLYPYIVSKAAELGIFVHAINGWTDHLHVVAAIPPRHSVSSVVKRFKGSSSHFLNHQLGFDGAFAWQRGYGALTLGERQRSIAIAYVENQKAHHAEKSTNAWLERSAEFDQDPPELSPIAASESALLREAGAMYDILGEPLI